MLYYVWVLAPLGFPLKNTVLNKVLILAFAVVMFAAGACTLAYGGIFRSFADADISLPAGFTVTAHNGCEGTPEDSLEAVRVGIECGADVIEVDLRFLDDGTPVLSHDETKRGKEYALFEDALDLVLATTDVQMNVDAKELLGIADVYEMVAEKGGQSRVFLTGISEKHLDVLERECPEFLFWLNFPDERKYYEDAEYVKEYVQMAARRGAIGMNCNLKYTTPEYAAICRECGLKLSVWTAKTEIKLWKAFELEPDNVTTLLPRRAAELKKGLQQA